jgi:hypothetical protein
MPLWQQALASDPVDVRRVFEDYHSTVGFPASAFWREQMEAWPEAKVVLTVRDAHSWYRCAKRTIFAIPEFEPSDPDAVAFGRFVGEELLSRVFDFGGGRPLNEMDEHSLLDGYSLASLSRPARSRR